VSDIALDFVVYQPYPDRTEHVNDEARAVLEAVARLDRARIDDCGGYPSEVAFVYGCNGAQVWPELVAVASADSEGRPVLSLSTLSEYVSNARRKMEEPCH
jgi:hypothetical protein